MMVRCNPGEIEADGSEQGKRDEACVACSSSVSRWPSPDVTELKDAKNALRKIANMNIGLVDTLADYDAAELQDYHGHSASCDQAEGLPVLLKSEDPQLIGVPFNDANRLVPMQWLGIQLGYYVSDVTARCVVGMFVYCVSDVIA